MNTKQDKIRFSILSLVLLTIGLLLVPVAFASILPPATPALANPAPISAVVTSTLIDPDSPVAVESARALPAVVDEPDPWFAALSPDGAYLAYYTEAGRGRDLTGQICVFTFTNS